MNALQYIAILSIAVISYAVAQQDADVVKDALDIIYHRQNDPDVDEPAVYRTSPYPGDDRYLSYSGDPSSSANIDDDEEFTLPYEVFHKQQSYNRIPEKVFMNYLSEDNYDDDDIPEGKGSAVKRNPSVFRERIDHQQSQPPNKQIIEFLLTKMDAGNVENNARFGNDFQNELEYERMLQDYWEKYKMEKEWADRIAENSQFNSAADKRFSKAFPHRNQRYFASDNVVIKKRFPVTKRSSNYYSNKLKSHKRAAKSAQKHSTEKVSTGTDPKVARDLSHIFGNEQKNTDETKSKIIKKVGPESSTKESKPSKLVEKVGKEPVAPEHLKDKYVQVKKKSVEWSRYFGIDKRRKKSTVVQPDPNQMDDNWLVDRYKSALKKYEESEKDGKSSKRRDDSRLDNIKDKLKNIEDMIIDEALKYTGAHEGESDSKEIQEVKDKVMTRLAAAYSIEKMRRALGEFKKNVAGQREKLDKQYNGDLDLAEGTEDSQPNHKVSGENQEPNGVLEKKRNLNAEEIDDDNKDDNNIAQVVGETDCNIIGIIERQCANLAAQFREEVVQPLCMLHQICNVCGMDETSLIAKERNLVDESIDMSCFYMYMTESERACAGDAHCRRSTHFALNTLRGDISAPMNAAMCLDCGSECLESALASARHHIQLFNIRNSI